MLELPKQAGILHVHRRRQGRPAAGHDSGQRLPAWRRRTWWRRQGQRWAGQRRAGPERADRTPRESKYRRVNEVCQTTTCNNDNVVIARVHPCYEFLTVHNTIVTKHRL